MFTSINSTRIADFNVLTRHIVHKKLIVPTVIIVKSSEKTRLKIDFERACNKLDGQQFQ